LQVDRLPFRAVTAMVSTEEAMGDQSPKAKQRGEKQKKQQGQKDAAKAKSKQDQQGKPKPMGIK
jgi:hypothetical protein